MNRIQLTKNFYLDELVDPVTYFTLPDHGLSKINPVIVDCLQLLRDYYGKSIDVNRWWEHLPANLDGFDCLAFLREMEEKKVSVWSGYRSQLCKIGAKASAHKKGFAVDPKGDEDVFLKIVMDHAKEFYSMGLRRIEDTRITNRWLHMDCEPNNHVAGKIRVINLSDHVADIIVSTGEYKLVA